MSNSTNTLNITIEEQDAFIEKYSLTHKEAAKLEDVKGGIFAESECLINFGYVWLTGPCKWVNKNHSSYTDRDVDVLNFIRTIQE